MNDVTRTSKEKLPDWLRRWYALKGEPRFREAADEIERLQRERDAYRALAGIGFSGTDEADELAKIDPPWERDAEAMRRRQARGLATMKAVADAVRTGNEPGACVHPWERIGFSSDGHPFCGACCKNLVKDPPWRSEPPAHALVCVGQLIQLDDGLGTVFADWNEERFKLEPGAKLYAQRTSETKCEGRSDG